MFFVKTTADIRIAQNHALKVSQQLEGDAQILYDAGANRFMYFAWFGAQFPLFSFYMPEGGLESVTPQLVAQHRAEWESRR